MKNREAGILIDITAFGPSGLNLKGDAYIKGLVDTIHHELRHAEADLRSKNPWGIHNRLDKTKNDARNQTFQQEVAALLKNDKDVRKAVDALMQYR